MSEIKMRKMQVTPELAKKWLKTNIDNRKLSEAHVRKLARDMSNNDFPNLAETIKFDTEGHLIDGQHRLEAAACGDRRAALGHRRALLPDLPDRRRRGVELLGGAQERRGPAQGRPRADPAGRDQPPPGQGRREEPEDLHGHGGQGLERPARGPEDPGPAAQALGRPDRRQLQAGVMDESNEIMADSMRTFERAARAVNKAPRATDAQRAAEERELRVTRALDDLRDAIRDVLDEAEEKVRGTWPPVSAFTYDPRRFLGRIREIVDDDPTESTTKVRATSMEADRERGLWYVYVLDEPVHHTTEGAPVNLDWTREGNLIGIKILGPYGELPAAPAPQVFFPGDMVPAGVPVTEMGGEERRVYILNEAGWSWKTRHTCVALPIPSPDEWEAIVERAQAERQQSGQYDGPLMTLEGEEVNAMSDPETEQTEEQQGRGDTHNGPTFPDRK